MRYPYRRRPLIVTTIVAIMALFFTYRFFRVARYVAQHPRSFEAVDFLGPMLIFTLSYFLLRGKNWARLVISIVSMYVAFVLADAMLFEGFSMPAWIAAAGMFFMSGTFTLNRNVVAYFKKQKLAQQAGPAFPPPEVGSADP